MRTTLYLDDDLADKLRKMAHARRTSLRRVVNEMLRRGMLAQEHKRRATKPYRVPIFRSPFRPGVDPLRLNQLVDDLEARSLGDGQGQ